MNQTQLRGQGVDIKQTTEVKCDKCENVTFNQGMFLRKVSALVNPEGRDAYLPVPTFYCTSCGNVNEEFVPAELKNKIQLVQNLQQPTGKFREVLMDRASPDSLNKICYGKRSLQNNRRL